MFWGAVGHCASNVPGTIGQCDHNVSRAVGHCLGLALVIRSIIAGRKKSLMGDGKAGEEHKGIRKHKLVLVLVLVTEIWWEGKVGEVSLESHHVTR